MMKQVERELLAIEVQDYIYQKSGEIMDEVLALFPEIEEVGTSLVLEYAETTGNLEDIMKGDDAI